MNNSNIEQPKEIKVKSDKPWYNRPLMGDKSLLETIMTPFQKLEVPQDIIFIYFHL